MTKYKNKKTGWIGEVIHYKGVTTTLRFDNGDEVILTPATLRNEWIVVDEEEIVHLTQSEFYSKMYEWNASHDENKAELFGVIVYKQENFSKPYSETSRSYRVCNANRTFQSDKISNSLFGDCLDGTDNGVRLDWYKWSVEYCYFE